MVATPQPTYSPSASSCQSQGGSMLGDASESGHLLTHAGVPHQSQNGELSPKSMVETSSVQMSINQNHSNVCDPEISEDVVSIGQYPTAVKIEEVTNDGSGVSESSTGNHYLSSNQHQSLLSVTSATLNSGDSYARAVHHHHHMNTSDRDIGDPGVLYGMYP